MEKSEFNRRFGLFLKEKRISKGWTQADLASELGNNFQNISRIERGLITPTIFWVQRIATVFECSTSQLMSEFERAQEKAK